MEGVGRSWALGWTSMGKRWRSLTQLLTQVLARPATKLLLTLGLAMLLLPLSGCQTRVQPQTPLTPGTVQRIISGNTLEVMVPSLANNQLQRVRLIGLDAPSPAQRPWGKAAMDFLRQVDKQTVQLEFDLEREASYSRLLAYVWQDGRLLNQALLAEGHAVLDSRLPNIRYDLELRRAQEAARLQGLGIWDPANPMRQTPDEFRDAQAR